MNRSRRSLSLVLAALASLAAVAGPVAAGPDGDIDYASLAGATVSHIEQRNMDRFDLVDDHHMIVWARRNQAYLVTFQSTCRRYSLQDPLVVERNSNFRLYPQDRITINGTPCQIKDIRILDVPALKAAKAAAR